MLCVSSWEMLLDTNSFTLQVVTGVDKHRTNIARWLAATSSGCFLLPHL